MFPSYFPWLSKLKKKLFHIISLKNRRTHDNCLSTLQCRVFNAPITSYTLTNVILCWCLVCLHIMSLLPDTQHCGLRMRRECRERFLRHRLQRKPLVSDPGMHHGTCFTHVPWCMSGSQTRGGGENVPGIPCACTTHNFAYLCVGVVNSICMFTQYLRSHQHIATGTKSLSVWRRHF